MKSVTFYSYKGGTGRTLLLANTAFFLASAGLRVVVLDLDLEAPGLPYKFALKSKTGPWELGPGIVGELSSYLDHPSRHLDVRKICRPIPPRGGAAGTVSLIPAGPAPSFEYAESLSKIDWYSLYWGRRPDTQRSQRSHRSGSLPRWREVFTSLSNQIEEKLTPDYLLIDSRTGLADISGISLNFFPDTIVCLMLGNDENLEGARQALSGAKAIATAKRRALRILPVITRIPTSASALRSDKAISESVTRYLTEASHGKRFHLRRRDIEAVLCLHSEPSLEAFERLLSDDNDVTLRESALLRDYLSFFSHFDAAAFDKSRLSASFRLLSDNNVRAWLSPISRGRGNGWFSNSPPEVKSMADRVKSRKMLRVVPAYYLPKAKNYNSFALSIIERLEERLGVSETEIVRETSIDYDLLGFLMREGRFDFCSEAYFLTPLRGELADLLQFGTLNSCLLVYPKLRLPNRLARTLTGTGSAGALDDALRAWHEFAEASNSRLAVGMLGETAATSAATAVLGRIVKANEIKNFSQVSRLAQFLMETPHGQVIRLGIIDHGVFARMERGRNFGKQFEAKVMVTTLALHRPMPAGFLLPPGDERWRREVAHVASEALRDLGPTGWEKVQQELSRYADVKLFEYEMFCKYLSLDMTLSQANQWLGCSLGPPQSRGKRSKGYTRSLVRTGS